jgi:histidine phosphotransfer protein HptB
MNQQLNTPIDIDQLNQISEGDIEFEIEVLQVYVEDVSQRLEQIREAIALHDYPQIMKQAHHIKGSSSNVGATQMQIFASKLEHLDRDQTPQNFLNFIDNMLDEIQVVKQYIAVKAETLTP